MGVKGYKNEVWDAAASEPLYETQKMLSESYAKK